MAEKLKCFGRAYNPNWTGCKRCLSRRNCRMVTHRNKTDLLSAKSAFTEREIFYRENPGEIIHQLSICDYRCEGGKLVNNIAFVALEELIEDLEFMKETNSQPIWYKENPCIGIDHGIPFGEMTISMDVSYDDYRKWYLGDWGPSPVKTYEEEKEMNEVKTVRVIGVTFNVNTHKGNDRRVFQYLCPFNVKCGDVIIADTMYGASLARVVKVDNFDANNSCYYTGRKTVISGPIDLILSKNYAVREATEMVRECEENALTLEKIRKLENKRSKLRKDLEKTECERSFIYRELGDIQSEVCNLKRKAGISLE